MTGVQTCALPISVAGPRRYEFTIVLKHHKESSASYVDALELRSLVFDGTLVSTTPTTSGYLPTTNTLTLELIEGVATGDRNVQFTFEKVFFESISEPKAYGDGVFETTITGYALSGLTDGTDKKPVAWYTV